MSEKQTENTLPVPPETDLANIVLPEYWNRDKPGSLKDLTTSIKECGQQTPVLVRPQKGGKFLLVDGRRRYMVLKDLKIKTIRIAPKTGKAEEDYLHSLVVNLQREGHNPMEKARVFKELSESGKKNREIARACGVTEGSVSQHLSFFELPAKMQRALRDERITPGHARQLLRVNEEEDMTIQEKFFEKCLEGMTVTDLEEVTAHYLHRKEEKAKAKTEAKKAKGKDGKGKGKGKAASGKSSSGSGRKPQTTDYGEYELNMVSKTKALELLNYYEGVRVKTRSPKKNAFYKGVLQGLELAAGIMEFED